MEAPLWWEEGFYATSSPAAVVEGFSLSTFFSPVSLEEPFVLSEVITEGFGSVDLGGTKCFRWRLEGEKIDSR